MISPGNWNINLCIHADPLQLNLGLDRVNAFKYLHLDGNLCNVNRSQAHRIKTRVTNDRSGRVGHKLLSHFDCYPGAISSLRSWSIIIHCPHSLRFYMNLIFGRWLITCQTNILRTSLFASKSIYCPLSHIVNVGGSNAAAAMSPSCNPLLAVIYTGRVLVYSYRKQTIEIQSILLFRMELPYGQQKRRTGKYTHLEGKRKKANIASCWCLSAEI